MGKFVQRHVVARVAAENGWGRSAMPHYDVFARQVRGGDPTEVEVFYFSTDPGRILGARIRDLEMDTSVLITRPGIRKLDDVISTLTAPGV
jgi:hypothetical protein